MSTILWYRRLLLISVSRFYLHVYGRPHVSRILKSFCVRQWHNYTKFESCQFFYVFSCLCPCVVLLGSYSLSFCQFSWLYKQIRRLCCCLESRGELHTYWNAVFFWKKATTKTETKQTINNNNKNNPPNKAKQNNITSKLV